MHNRNDIFLFSYFMLLSYSLERNKEVDKKGELGVGCESDNQSRNVKVLF
jgi:hypothetical protein